MDKKNTFIGMLFLVAALAMIPLMNKRREDATPTAAQKQPPAQAEQAITNAAPLDESPVSTEAIEQAVTSAQKVIEAAEETASVLEELSYLKNDLIEVIFTNQGGGIKKVAMSEYKATKGSEDPFLFNHHGYAPMLGISINDGSYDESYTKTFQSDTEIHFERQSSDGLLVRKKFTINPSHSDKEEYSIHHSIEFVNTGSNSLLVNDYALHLGTMEPALLGGGTLMGGYLNLGYYEDDDEDLYN